MSINYSMINYPYNINQPSIPSANRMNQSLSHCRKLNYSVRGPNGADRIRKSVDASEKQVFPQVMYISQNNKTTTQQNKKQSKNHYHYKSQLQFGSQQSKRRSMSGVFPNYPNEQKNAHQKSKQMSHQDAEAIGVKDNTHGEKQSALHAHQLPEQVSNSQICSLIPVYERIYGAQSSVEPENKPEQKIKQENIIPKTSNNLHDLYSKETAIANPNQSQQIPNTFKSKYQTNKSIFGYTSILPTSPPANITSKNISCFPKQIIQHQSNLLNINQTSQEVSNPPTLPMQKSAMRPPRPPKQYLQSAVILEPKKAKLPNKVDCSNYYDSPSLLGSGNIRSSIPVFVNQSYQGEEMSKVLVSPTLLKYGSSRSQSRLSSDKS